ncbi:transposase family protein [Streptomyces sp. NPDC001780]
MTVLARQAGTSFWDSLVFDGIDDVDVDAVTAAFGTVHVTANGRAASAACPDCSRSSNRVHDSYQRGLKDLPLAGQSVVIHLTVRRFICGTGHCPRHTFAEPFVQLTARRHAGHRPGRGDLRRLPSRVPECANICSSGR